MLRFVALRSPHCGGKRYSTDPRRRLKGVVSAEPERPMGTHPSEPGPPDVLFAYAELRSHWPPCSLHCGRIGLIASLLLAALSHRLADAPRSNERETTPWSWPSFEECGLGRSLSTSLHRDPSSARWPQATSSSHSAPLRARIR
jgi:hypothetical protein